MGSDVSVRFHRSLYAPDAVRRAAERFAPLVEALTVEEHESDLRVTLTGVPERLTDRIGDELGNHALFETVVAQRGAE